MRRFAVMLAIGLLSAAPAGAQIGRKYTMLGHGSSTCGQWIADRREDGIGANSDRAWLLGYVTAFNKFGGQPGGNVSAGVDPEGMVVWMDNYCAAHPLEPISEGASNLIADLRKR